LIVVGLIHALMAELRRFLATFGQLPQKFIDWALFCFVKTIYKNDDVLDSLQDLILELFVHDKDKVAVHAKS
jgi:hypothetical protein